MSTGEPSGWTGTERLLGATVLLLILFVGGLAWKVAALREDLATRSPGADPGAVAELLRTEVEDSEGRTRRIGDEDWEIAVLFAFSPQDCPICHEELLDLGLLAEGTPGLAAYGIFGHGDAEEARQTRENFHLTFPIVPDPEGRWISALAPPEMPWKIVLRKGRSGILWEDRRSTTPPEARAFINRLRSSLVHDH